MEHTHDKYKAGQNVLLDSVDYDDEDTILLYCPEGNCRQTHWSIVMGDTNEAAKIANDVLEKLINT